MVTYVTNFFLLPAFKVLNFLARCHQSSILNREHTTMATPQPDRGQMLLVEEYFATECSSFLEALRKVTQPKALAGFADRWKKDPRPWARDQLLAYLGQPLNCPGHQPVIKHLFKHAEETGDHEIMVAFLVAFRRLVRRDIRTKHPSDFRARTS